MQKLVTLQKIEWILYIFSLNIIAKNIEFRKGNMFYINKVITDKVEIQFL